jgi:hypothetical protein
MTVGSPRVDEWSELGRRGYRRGGSTAAGGVCRGGSRKRRGGRRLGQHVTPGGALGSREASGVVGRRWERAAAQGHRRQRQWRAGWLGGARRGMLTPKFGTGESLICGPNLVKISSGRARFLQKIRKKSLRSAVCFHSAKGLFALILRDCVVTWPERKGWMDG